MAAEVAAALIINVLSSRCSNFRIEIVFSISPEKINYISWLLNIKTQNLPTLRIKSQFEGRQWNMMKVKDRCKPPPKEKQLYSLKAAASKHSSGTEQDWWNNALRFLGLIAGLYLAYLYTCQLQLLHENQLWFSHLTVSVTECFTSRQRDLCAGAAYYHWIRIAQELERDLSFRSESALYYSYYKQLVTAPSLYKGKCIILHDMRLYTCSSHTHCAEISTLLRARNINSFQDFSILPEIFLATLYRVAGLKARRVL